jgi:hypothetical protein
MALMNSNMSDIMYWELGLTMDAMFDMLAKL